MYAHRQPSLAVNLTINRLDIQVTYHFHVLYKEKRFKSDLCTVVRLIDHNRNVRFIDRDTFTSSTECSAEPDRSLSFIFGLQL